MVNDSLKRQISLEMPVLVVDDSKVNCEIVSKILRALGFKQVQYVVSAAESLPELRSLRYGLLVTDLEMSPMSGIDLIKCVRSDNAISTIPIVLMTGNKAAAARMTLQHETSYADVHILKPFTPDTLLNKLRAKFVFEDTAVLQ